MAHSLLLTASPYCKMKVCVCVNIKPGTEGTSFKDYNYLLKYSESVLGKMYKVALLPLQNVFSNTNTEEIYLFFSENIISLILNENPTFNDLIYSIRPSELKSVFAGRQFKDSDLLTFLVFIKPEGSIKTGTERCHFGV